MTAALAARSRSASASTIIGSLPPSSRLTGVSVSAACAITFLPVATEPVNITKSTSSTSAAPVSPRPVATWKTPSGRPALGEHLGHQQRGQRGDLGRLEDDRVAGRERRDAVAERVVERVVPGADHADHAERRVADVELAAARRTARRDSISSSARYAGACFGPELERREAVGELGELRLVGRPAGLAADRLDDPLAVGDQPAPGGEQDLGPARRTRPPPTRAGRRAPRRRSRATSLGAEVGNGRRSSRRSPGSRPRSRRTRRLGRSWRESIARTRARRADRRRSRRFPPAGPTARGGRRG